MYCTQRGKQLLARFLWGGGGGQMRSGLLSFLKMTFFEGISGEFPPIILIYILGENLEFLGKFLRASNFFISCATLRYYTINYRVAVRH
jgi:hypothetical protein